MTLSPPGGSRALAHIFNDVAFAGRMWDNNAELYNNNARWYDASTGRFLGEDPAQENNNWYAYAGNDPINFRDPTGLSQAGNPLNSLAGGFAGGIINQAPDPIQFSPIFNTQTIGTPNQLFGANAFRELVSPSITTTPQIDFNVARSLGTGPVAPSFRANTSPVLSSSSPFTATRSFDTFATPVATNGSSSLALSAINLGTSPLNNTGPGAVGRRLGRDLRDTANAQSLQFHQSLVNTELGAIAQTLPSRNRNPIDEARQFANVGSSFTPIVNDVRDIAEVVTERDAFTGQSLSGFQYVTTVVGAVLPFVSSKSLRMLFDAPVTTVGSTQTFRNNFDQAFGLNQGNIAANAAAGRARELRVQGKLEGRFGSQNVLRQRTLLDAKGNVVIDPVTQTGRRVDFVVLDNVRNARFAPEVTSRNQARNNGKKFQLEKEDRIRDAGGTFVRDPRTGQLINVSGIPTRVIGVEPR